MKTKKLSRSGVQCNYATPTILALSLFSIAPPLHANTTGWAMTCHAGAHSSQLARIYFSGVRSKPYYHCHANSDVATAGRENTINLGSAICIPLNQVLKCKTTPQTTKCHFSAPTFGLIPKAADNLLSEDKYPYLAQTPPNIAPVYNALTTLATHQAAEKGLNPTPYGPQTNPTNSASITLAEVTLGLVLKELNKTAGGIKLKRGELIDSSTITPEQQVVLQNHMGLMKEAIRQLKAERVKNVSALREFSNEVTRRMDNTGSTDEPR